MKRRELTLAATGLLLLAAAAPVGFLQNPALFHAQDQVLRTANCSVPYSRFEPASSAVSGTAIIFHGLSANRKLMEPAAGWMVANRLRAFTVDLPGHGDSTDPFSFERAEQCAAAVVDSLSRSGEAELTRTVLVGHSMGGAIAIRLADRFTLGATVAISPAPLTPLGGAWQNVTPYKLPLRLPSNLLVLLGQFDPFPLRQSARTWVAEAGGNDNSEAAFRERRALELTQIPRATHTSLLFDPAVADATKHWVRRAFDLPSKGEPLPSLPWARVPALLGVLLIFPAAATATCHVLRATKAEAASPPPFAPALLVWTFASLAAIVLLQVGIPLRALRVLTGDYLASFLLITGAIALPWIGRIAPRPYDAASAIVRLLGASVLLGLLAVLSCGAVLAWQITDAWMNSARWMRFPFVLLAAWPCALAEEWALGPVGAGLRAATRRLAYFLSLRGVLWLAMLVGFLALGSKQVLLLLMALYLVAFSVAQRLGADAVRRRTGSPAAAALFSAILAAWFIAAVFPLT